MRVFLAAVTIALLAGPAFAQGRGAPPAGGQKGGKSPQEIAAEKEADKAYHRSLGNIPDQPPADPWGHMRGDGEPKPVAKTAPVKRAKTDSATK